jgi:hypothetical protein
MEQTTFTDSDGVLWNVREDGADEVRSLTADISPNTTWLRFESELEVRRLWHYPDDWRGLSPMQLESLLDRASTVIARFRPAAHREGNVGGSVRLSGTQPSELRMAPPRADVPPDIPRSRADDKSK